MLYVICTVVPFQKSTVFSVLFWLYILHSFKIKVPFVMLSNSILINSYLHTSSHYHYYHHHFSHHRDQKVSNHPYRHKRITKICVLDDTKIDEESIPYWCWSGEIPFFSWLLAMALSMVSGSLTSNVMGLSVWVLTKICIPTTKTEN